MTERPSASAMFAEAVRAHPDRPCLVAGEQSLTYAEVEQRATAVAHQLRDTGVDAGDRVAVWSPNDVHVMVATLGILRAGATWMPLNPRDSVESNADLCARFGVNVVIHHADFADAVGHVQSSAPAVRHVVALDRLTTGASTDVADLVEPAPDALAAVFATGGTTGTPKGVCYSHRTLSAIVGNYVEMIDDPDCVFLAAGPLTHVSGRAALGVMAAGGTTVVLTQFDTAAALSAIEHHRVTATVLPVTMLRRLLADQALATTDTSSLHRVWVGASPVPIDLLKRARAELGPVVTQNYGQTEAPMFITTMHPGDYEIDGVLVADSRLVSCGRPTPFCELRLLDADGNDVATGDAGEIVVRGDFVMDGYLDDPAATAASRIGGFHRTGDLGTLDADGYLTIVGRLRQVIITGGFNVYPAEVEGVLAERPEVYESAVIGVPDPEWGERVVAFIELNPGATFDPDDLQQFLRKRLGGVKAPKQFVVVDSIPRNANGKILKRDLRAPT